MNIVKIKTSLYLIMLLSSSSQAGQENWDLKCTLDTGGVMTLSHKKDTVYITYKPQDKSSDKGSVVIKMDTNSGETQQSITANDVTDNRVFVLRGTGENIEGAMAITYEEYKGQPDAHISVMNPMGKEIESHACLTNTINARSNLLYAGIEHMPFIH
ncbi:hypothetical protein [Escherichia albertii]|uniref:hypothetical protein n=1 Tax=Escherichia albertii TaxID=208962 RepID=UPI00169FC787|nr:hypothetical protein [Escherichia albertii]MCQ8909582.1 hypothetical protein [Escherichia albertii]MCQ8958494.1 hypothetical protein [Escherichia albertii]MCQ8990123.1 hypothetical protein [Escherichia albertii]UUL29914.1 hypothetical protein NIY90_09515 [Escherichia albertii]UUL46987.1 hypothetical protein NIY84_05590 [Escherichia albertii]